MSETTTTTETATPKKKCSMKDLKAMFKAFEDAEALYEKHIANANMAKREMSAAVKMIAESGHEGPFIVKGRTLRVSRRKSKEEGGEETYFFRAFDESAISIS